MSSKTFLIIVGVVIGLYLLYPIFLPRFDGFPPEHYKSIEEHGLIRNIDTQIELYQVNTGYYPSFPNMDEMFTSTSYFPDGFPKDPFTGEKELGVYTLDMNVIGYDENKKPILRMRTNTFMHLCIQPYNNKSKKCGGFKPKHIFVQY